MAFVRWRGNCAQLLTTITVDGRPRQQLLVNLRGAFATTPRMWAQVAANFPAVRVDWAAVDRALAEGPPTAPPAPPEHLTAFAMAHQLRVWATSDQGTALERQVLDQAAIILIRWHSQF